MIIPQTTPLFLAIGTPGSKTVIAQRIVAWQSTPGGIHGDELAPMVITRTGKLPACVVPEQAGTLYGYGETADDAKHAVARLQDPEVLTAAERVAVEFDTRRRQQTALNEALARCQHTHDKGLRATIDEYANACARAAVAIAHQVQAGKDSKAKAQRGTCPACGKDALLDTLIDRYVHADGSLSLDCWRKATRGES